MRIKFLGERFVLRPAWKNSQKLEATKISCHRVLFGGRLLNGNLLKTNSIALTTLNLSIYTLCHGIAATKES